MKKFVKMFSIVLVLMLVPIMLVACRDDKDPPPAPTHIGTYQYAYEVEGGTAVYQIVLKDDNTGTSSTSFNGNEPAGHFVQEFTYTLNENSLAMTLTADTSIVIRGTFSNDFAVLTLSAENGSAVLNKATS
jgi:uncharacterized lipoprotein YehR (DUF1307 family)